MVYRLDDLDSFPLWVPCRRPLNEYLEWVVDGILAPHCRAWALYHASRVRRFRQSSQSLREIFDEIEVALVGHLQTYWTDGSFEETAERLDLLWAEHESGFYGSVQILENAPRAEFEMFVRQDGLELYVI